MTAPTDYDAQAADDAQEGRLYTVAGEDWDEVVEAARDAARHGEEQLHKVCELLGET